MENISKNDIPSIVGYALDTQEQLLKEIAGNNIKNLYYSATHSIWVMEFHKGEDMTFVDFDSMYTWVTSEGMN